MVLRLLLQEIFKSNLGLSTAVKLVTSTIIDGVNSEASLGEISSDYACDNSLSLVAASDDSMACLRGSWSFKNGVTVSDLVDNWDTLEICGDRCHFKIFEDEYPF